MTELHSSHPTSSPANSRSTATSLQQVLQWIWRSSFVTHTQSGKESGFILPTVTFLLLIMSLVVGVLVYRTFARTAEVSGQRQQRTLYNAATPAIDRGKAKLEYLFAATNLTGLPSDSDLSGAFNDTIFTLNDETRLDLNDDGTEDNAWAYEIDNDGDGVGDSLVIYSILHAVTGDNNTPADLTDDNTLESSDADKAPDLVVRSGPIDLNTGAQQNCPIPDLNIFGSWEPTSNTGFLRKAFQVHAVAINIDPDTDTDAAQSVSNTSPFATLEMQQDRQGTLGNRWGAWFLSDLEFSTNASLFWNGSMHTEASFIFGENNNINIQVNAGIGDNGSNAKSRLYLVSSLNSCVYSLPASEISMTERLNEDIDGDGSVDVNFQGQVLIGEISDNTVHQNDRFEIDEFVSVGVPTTEQFDAVGTGANPDSVRDELVPSDFLVDPIQLFVEGTPAHRGFPLTDDPSVAIRDNSFWSEDNLLILSSQRVRNSQEPIPFVDDRYRADDRWGPNPLYGFDRSISVEEKGVMVGETITTTNAGTGDFQALTNLVPADDEQDFGLDGYWERRARNQGIRIVVGQRLELGNAFGWGSNPENTGDPLNPDNEPLYPPAGTAISDVLGNVVDSFVNNSTMAAFDNGTVSGRDRSSELQHWRTLHDNLAAVQSTAIYHYNNDVDYPIACLATTVHPGTATTDQNSRNFDTASLGGVTRVRTDFLALDDDADGNFAEGTNGWEFAPPLGTAAAFETAINTASSPMRIALKNLATFAGDEFGAFPPTQDSNDGTANDAINTMGSTVNNGHVTHPYPYTSMWGDFSNLRRVIEDSLEAVTPVAYDDLSVADRTTLQTAGCTLGLLAYNLKNIYNEVSDIPNNAASAPDLSELGNELVLLMDGVVDNATGNYEMTTYDPMVPNLCGDMGDDIGGMDSDGCPDTDPYSPFDPDYYADFTPEEWITYLEAVLTAKGVASGDITTYTTWARALLRLQQIERDRTYGFAVDQGGILSNDVTGIRTTGVGDYTASTYSYVVDGGFTGYGGITAGQTFEVGCDPLSFDVVGANASEIERRRLGLAVALCFSDTSNQEEAVKYPSLYYLFPRFAHDHDGANDTATTTIEIDHAQPTTEDYIADVYISTMNDADTTPADPTDDNDTYQDLDGIANLGVTDIDAIDLTPRASDFSDWVTPVASVAADRANDAISVNGVDSGWPAFLERALYDGRQLMNVRVMSMDLDLLRRNAFDSTDADSGNSHWLPLRSDLTSTGSILYLFREDSMREDGIVRPRSTTWASCAALGNYLVNDTNYNAACTMNVALSAPNDPPVNDTTGISPKPVDLYPDPLRQVNGFWLRNGEDLRRLDSMNAVIADAQRGSTFVTADVIYADVDFNIHSDGTDRLEEFDDTLLSADPDYSEFYNRTSLDTDFASENNDSWRPVEIVADAVTILSPDFNAGFIQDGLIDVENDSVNRNSYRAINEAYQDTDNSGLRNAGEDGLDATNWIRADGTTTNLGLPIKLSRNNFPLNTLATSASNEWGVGVTPLAPQQQNFRQFRESRGAWGTLSGAMDGWQQNAAIAHVTDVPDNGPYEFNATIVQNIVPTQADQSDGGLINFPRFLEEWSGVSLPNSSNEDTLRIAGALFQLGYNTIATGLFDQDAWEPGEPTEVNDPSTPFETEGTYTAFYGRPSRAWGFDPGLLYAPPGPVAVRFASTTLTRSEFYRELPIDDPYIVNLLCAKYNDSGTMERIIANISVSGSLPIEETDCPDLP